MDSAIIRAVIEAVASDGFQSRLIGESLRLEGIIKVREHEVPLRVEIDDLTFASSPRLIIADLSALPRPVMPHVDPYGEICAFDRSYYLLDRHRVPAQIRGMLVRAREVLERGLTKVAVSEIAAEFPSHWASTYILVNLVRSTGAARIENSEIIVDGRTKDVQAWLITTDRELSFDADQKRPDSFGDLLDWSRRWDRTLPTRIIEGLARCGPSDPYIIISAPNGIVIAQIKVSKRGARFQTTLTKSKVWRAILSQPQTRSWSISRSFGKRSDLEHVLGKNGEDTAPLSGKDIVLVGCGAIGGYLARMLAQSGAGLSGGHLTLIDSDKLAILNIRRHALGKPSVGKSKVESCRDMIVCDFPGLTVTPLAIDVQKAMNFLPQADLVIDATGEQGVSELLNDWSLRRQADGCNITPLLHVWIEGAGAAVQTYLHVDPSLACYRCLQPSHDKRPRFSPLYGVQPEPVAACGEQPFTPYGPASPTMAAALAIQHAIDWSNENPMPLLRTVVLRRDLAHNVPEKNPPPKSQCPACSRATQST